MTDRPNAIWLQLTPREGVQGKVWVRWLDVVTMRHYDLRSTAHDARIPFTGLGLQNRASLEVRETPEQILAKVQEVAKAHAPLT